VQVIGTDTVAGGAVLGVVDGGSPLGVETASRVPEMERSGKPPGSPAETVEPLRASERPGPMVAKFAVASGMT